MKEARRNSDFNHGTKIRALSCAVIGYLLIVIGAAHLNNQ